MCILILSQFIRIVFANMFTFAIAIKRKQMVKRKTLFTIRVNY